jgi:Uma2 family endonuclease
MTSAEAIQELLASPALPNAIERLSAVLKSERERREKFYDEITPSMKAEFINGEVIVHSPVSLNHLNASKNIMLLLDAFVRQRSLGQVFSEKALIALTRNDYEPDVSFFSSNKAARFREEQTKFPAPDLTVEILSPSTEHRDRGIKFEDYAAHRVQEYWIVNSEAKEVEQYQLKGGEYKLILKSSSGEIRSVAVEGFIIPVRAVFDSDLAFATLKEIIR